MVSGLAPAKCPIVAMGEPFPFGKKTKTISKCGELRCVERKAQYLEAKPRTLVLSVPFTS